MPLPVPDDPPRFRYEDWSDESETMPGYWPAERERDWYQIRAFKRWLAAKHGLGRGEVSGGPS